MTGEKQVFISHSSKDFDFAMKLCQAFEAAGLGCWIAPRDIPYGNVWAAEITEGIEKAKLMLFILSRHSAGSNQVVREISLALQQGLRVIPVRLDGSRLSGALAYYLSNVQAIQLDPDSPEQLDSLLEHVRACLEGKQMEPQPASPPAQPPEEDGEFHLDTAVNLDEELDAVFDRVFGPEAGNREREVVSPFRQKLLKRIGDRVLTTMFSGVEEEPPEEPSREEGCDMYFTLTDRDSITQVFLVRKNYCLPDYHEMYEAEQLEFTTEEQEDGSLERTYSVVRPDVEGNPLIVITFLPGQSMAVINMGFLDRESVRISKQPRSMPFREFSGKGGAALRWPANEDGRKVIMDPETGQVIPRKRFYDRKKKEWITYLELPPGKRMFAFELSVDTINGGAPEEDPDILRCHIGLSYYRGAHGLPQNMLKAAEFFEESGTPEAHYYLGRVFLEDPLLGDPEDARYYLTLALESGEERARELL